MRILRTVFNAVVLSVTALIFSVGWCSADVITFDEQEITPGQTLYAVDVNSDGAEDAVFTTQVSSGFQPNLGQNMGLSGIEEPALGGYPASYSINEVVVTFPSGAKDSIAFHFAVSGDIKEAGNVYIQIFNDAEGRYAAQTTSASLYHNDTDWSEGLLTISFSGWTAEFARINFYTTGTGFILDNFEFLPAAVRGDIDNSGRVELSDAVLSLSVMSDSAEGFLVDVGADVNLDGRIGNEDTSYIMQKISESR